MNCALEYILRDKRVEKMLSFPCSLFLESKKPKKHTKKAVNVLKLTQNGNVSVNHYEIFNAVKEKPLPIRQEIIIPADKVFASEAVVVPGYRLFEFVTYPYTSLEKQVSEMPLGVVQERQYNECLDYFYTPKKFNLAREDWLWEAFTAIYCQDHSFDKWKHILPAKGRAYILAANKEIEALWTHWLDNLLFQTDPASELIFAWAYQSKFLFRKPKKDEEEIARNFGDIWFGPGE